jgi:cell fate (sporulation/competence/biofilm development) regulator YlbF (YheA/YmcA/DUF963 family)
MPELIPNPGENPMTIATPQMQSLLERLEKLERQSRRLLRLAFLGIAVLFLTLGRVAYGQTGSNTKDNGDVTLVMYNLIHDSSNWEKRVNQFRNHLQLKYPQDKMMGQSLEDANQQLVEVRKSAATLSKSQTVAEAVAISFELQALSRDLSVMVLQLVGIHACSDSTIQAGPSLQDLSQMWSQAILDVARELKTYEEGMKSYTYMVAVRADKEHTQLQNRRK